MNDLTRDPPPPLSAEELDLHEYLASGQPAIFLADRDADSVVIRPHGGEHELRLSRVFARYLRHALDRTIQQLEDGRPKRG